MDEAIFKEEQQHLSHTYAKLEAIRDEVTAELERLTSEALADRESMLDELSLDFADFKFETYADYEMMHHIIDAYNLSTDINLDKLAAAQLLLKHPYFAKVALQFKPNQEPKEIYIGACGMTDGEYRYLVVDWRSPVAETYYNQANGPTSYEADGRTITCDLKLRRQFDIEGNKLNAYFDTTVAIEDPLLLQSLSKQRTEKMQAITTTIQKEQNQVIRHGDVPVLLVDGIAGSGKTSVLLQRIAYLMYRKRQDLDPSQVFLITPNPVFQRYIDNVLPELGERNPQTMTFAQLMASLGLEDRGLGEATSLASLDAIDNAVATLHLTPADFADICVDGKPVISAGKVSALAKKYLDKGITIGSHLAGLMQEELETRLINHLNSRVHNSQVWEALDDMSDEEQLKRFGQQMSLQEESDYQQLAKRYLEQLYTPAFALVEDCNWFRIDRIGMRILGSEHISATEWLYLKIALTGVTCRKARYVLIDEVQDYTQAQLRCLARYFSKADFMLLGDENQAIKEGTATFAQIEELFCKERAEVARCSLMTSYRSSPEITQLFTSLMPKDKALKTSSVQRPGTKPVVTVCHTKNDYAKALLEAIQAAESEEKLTAIICNSKRRLKWIAALLQDQCPTIISQDDALPASGVVLTSLELAKGLEFDSVIIPDAQAEELGDDVLSRHRLYTALSRATQSVHLLALGQLTPLLA